MQTSRLSTGKRFRWENCAYEVKRLLPERQVSLEALASGEAQVVSEETLVNALFAGALTFEKHPKPKPFKPNGKPDCVSPILLPDYPEPAKAAAELRLEILRPILALPAHERTEAKLMTYVDAVKQTKAGQGQPIRLSLRTLYRWLRAYLPSGADPRVLIPATTQRGSRQPRLPTELDDLICSVLRDHYYRREKVTVKAIRYIVAARVAEENQRRPAHEQMAVPSWGSIRRRIEWMDMRDRFKAKHGARAARRASHQYGQMTYPSLPLERVEMDHTRLDLLVVDEEDNLVLGHPTLTTCKDLATRYPLGYYVGFEPPSYYAVMECLYHSIQPKPNVREHFGTDHDWIAYGLPSHLVVDNGREFIGQDLQEACRALDIQLHLTRIGRPEDKASIEEQFRALNSGVIHTLPGTTFSNPQQRGDYDSARQACISLADFERILNLYIVDIYAEEFHRGLRGVPARRWEAAQTEGFSPRLPGSPQELLLLLSRTDTRTLQHYGIEFEHLRYNCPELGELRDRLRRASSKEVKIRYHPGDLGCLYLFDSFDHRYVEVPALNQNYARGLSLWKHRVICRLAREEEKRVDLAALGQAKLKIQGIVAEARARKRGNARLGRWTSTPQHTQPDAASSHTAFVSRAERAPRSDSLPPATRAERATNTDADWSLETFASHSDPETNSH